MRHLFLFENFISYIYEMDLTDPHYLERTLRNQLNLE